MTNVPSLSTDALASRIDAGEPLLLLDTRSAGAHASFPFDAAETVRLINLPGDELHREPSAALSRLPRPAEAGTVIAFCSRGNSSRAAVSALREAGYDALSLEGGILRWSERVVASNVPGGASLAQDAALLQVRRLGKGCLGYVVIAEGQALVIDAGRAVDSLLAMVEQRGARIAAVLDTHLHADHISGGPELARRTGVPYGLPPADATSLAYPFEPVTDGERWDLDGLGIRAIHTPGHTDGSTSYLVGDRFLLTGDTLFVNGVGRPDLSGQGQRLARVLHATLTRIIAKLPDDIVVLPAHVSGRQELGDDGVGMARLGDLKAGTLSRIPDDADRFAAEWLANLPEQPPNYQKVRAANRGVLADDPSELEFGPNRCAVRGP